MECGKKATVAFFCCPRVYKLKRDKEHQRCHHEMDYSDDEDEVESQSVRSRSFSALPLPYLIFVGVLVFVILIMVWPWFRKRLANFNGVRDGKVACQCDSKQSKHYDRAVSIDMVSSNEPLLEFYYNENCAFCVKFDAPLREFLKHTPSGLKFVAYDCETGECSGAVEFVPTLRFRRNKHEKVFHDYDLKRLGFSSDSIRAWAREMLTSVRKETREITRDVARKVEQKEEARPFYNNNFTVY